MMSIPIAEITDSTALPRPVRETLYEPGLVSDYYQVRRGYHVLRRKGSGTSYLVYTLSGQGFLRDAKDRLIVLERGHFALIESQTYQEYGTWPACGRWNCHWVHFDAQPHWTHWLPLADKSELRGVTTAHIASRSIQRQVSDLFFQLHTERKQVEPWRNASALNMLERILILARSTADQATAQPVDPRVWRVLQVIESSTPNPPSAAELSRVAGLSPSRLASVFKQNTGVSILAAVNRVRLRAAQCALQKPGTSVSDAAQRAGFQTPYSFSKWYLKQTGQRPREYRKLWLARLEKANRERDTPAR